VDICTWKNCDKEAEHRVNNNGGDSWANLCNDHFKTHESGLEDFMKGSGTERIKKMLHNWIMARGGADQAAKDLL